MELKGEFDFDSWPESVINTVAVLEAQLGSHLTCTTHSLHWSIHLQQNLKVKHGASPLSTLAPLPWTLRKARKGLLEPS